MRGKAGLDLRPGLVVSLATGADLLQWHPHLHLLTTDAGRTAHGSWQPLSEWDASLLMSLFRDRILARLLDRHAISKEPAPPILGTSSPAFPRSCRA